MDAVAESAAQSERDTCYWGELTGGLAAPTTWPLQSGQALDVYYSGSNDPKDGIYDLGYYRGVIDRIWKPTATGIQKVRIDYPDDSTYDTLELRASGQSWRRWESCPRRECVTVAPMWSR